jgi:hypothetical protein
LVYLPKHFKYLFYYLCHGVASCSGGGSDG